MAVTDTAPPAQTRVNASIESPLVRILDEAIPHLERRVAMCHATEMRLIRTEQPQASEEAREQLKEGRKRNSAKLEALKAYLLTTRNMRDDELVSHALSDATTLLEEAASTRPGNGR